MGTNEKKEELKFFYKKLIKDYIYAIAKGSYTEKKLKTLINRYHKNLKLSKKDYKKITHELLLEIKLPKYTLQVNSTQRILNIINQFDDITIKYNIEDIDDCEPAIYYYFKNNLYLINFDSIEDKWYLSLIEEQSLNLIEEIYSASYENFIKYLQNSTKKAVV